MSQSYNEEKLPHIILFTKSSQICIHIPQTHLCVNMGMSAALVPTLPLGPGSSIVSLLAYSSGEAHVLSLSSIQKKPWPPFIPSVNITNLGTGQNALPRKKKGGGGSRPSGTHSGVLPVLLWGPAKGKLSKYVSLRNHIHWWGMVSRGDQNQITVMPYVFVYCFSCQGNLFTLILN